MTSHPNRVLIVDGAPLEQQVSEVLAKQGFVCETAGNGPQAMEMLEAERFDVVISDLRMPNGRGRSFCLDLLQAENSPPTIVVTEEVQSHIVDALRSRGAADVCFKPIDYTALASKIKDLVERSDSAGENSSAAPASDDAKPASPASAVEGSEAENTETPAETDSDATAPPSLGGAASQAKRIVTILMKDDQRCDELSAKLSAVDIQAVTASGSEDLYRQLNQQRVDLVVIENDLGGFLTGLEILKRLADDLIRPESILLAEPSVKLNEQAQSLGIKTIIDPQADLDDLVKAIDGHSSDVGTRSELVPQQARKLVQDFDGIPPLPQLVLKLTGYMAMEVAEIPVKELANDISFDPKAISDLLKLTNSASMGLNRKITKVLDAVNLLGPKRTISLILASATFAAQSELLKQWPEELRKWYYKRSVLIASAASGFAEQLEKVSPDTAFVLGLLQDVGMLVLASTYGARYSAIIQRVREIGQLKLHQLEEKDFKIVHASVSGALLQKWKFPQSLIGPILDHHNPNSMVERSKLERSLMHSMRIGEALADLSDLAHPMRLQTLNQLLDKYGDENAKLCRTCLAEAVGKASESCKLFSLPIPDPEAMQELVATINASQEAEEQAVPAGAG